MWRITEAIRQTEGLQPGDPKLRSTYDATLASIHADFEVGGGDNFTGDPEAAFAHFHGLQSFESGLALPYARLFDDINGKRNYDSGHGRVPILFVNDAPLAKPGEKPLRRPEDGRTTSLALIEVGPLVVASTTQLIKAAPIEHYEPETTTVTRRVLELTAETATVDADMIHAASEPPRGVSVTRTSTLPLFVEQHGEDPRFKAKPQDRLNASAWSGSPNIFVGWDIIQGHLERQPPASRQPQTAIMRLLTMGRMFNATESNTLGRLGLR